MFLIQVGPWWLSPGGMSYRRMISHNRNSLVFKKKANDLGCDFCNKAGCKSCIWCGSTLA